MGKRDDFASFLSQYIHVTPGRYIDLDTGRVVGRHDGKETLTTGQGARIGGAPQRYFVASRTFPRGYLVKEEDEEGASVLSPSSSISIALPQHYHQNVLVVRGSNHPALFSRWLRVDGRTVFWVGGRVPEALLAPSFQPAAAASTGTRAPIHLHPLSPHCRNRDRHQRFRF